jgi:hypothetical protein
MCLKELLAEGLNIVLWKFARYVLHLVLIFIEMVCQLLVLHVMLVDGNA